MKERINWKQVLHRAAVSGRRAILANYNYASRREVLGKGVGGDMTLKIDKVSEQAIHNSLKNDLGDGSFVFLSEEVGEVRVKNGDSLPVVICDPLDGSHNAQMGIPFFSLSICVIQPGVERTFGSVSHGLVTSIKTDDEYFATQGLGAFHNGLKLQRRKKVHGKMETLIVETGDIDLLRDKLIKHLSLKLVHKPRILGSAALNFCLLADGSVDGYIFAQPGGARTIDSPAGYLIAKEAGCVFADLSRKNRNVDDVGVGFDCKLDLIGAPDEETLAELKKLVRIF